MTQCSNSNKNLTSQNLTIHRMSGRDIPTYIARVLNANLVRDTFKGAVKVKDTVKGFKEILEGKHDDLPEEAFRLVGTIEDAIEKAKTLK